MTPAADLQLVLGALLAADANTLAPAGSANKIHLVKAAFVPGPDLTVADLTFADFTGSTAIAGATGAQQVGVDPATGQQVVTIKVPAGGYRWATTNDVNLPQTIYGFALTDATSAALYATALLPEPVTLQETGQEIDLGNVTLTFVLEPIY